MKRNSLFFVVMATIILVGIIFALCFKILFPVKKDEPRFWCATCENEIKNPTHHSAVINDSIFMSFCSSCHFANKKRSTGPGLRGILSRIPTLDWVHNFIHNPDSMMKSGEPYPVKIFNENNNCPHPAFPQLSDKQIDRILSMCDSNGY